MKTRRGNAQFRVEEGREEMARPGRLEHAGERACKIRLEREQYGCHHESGGVEHDR